MVFSYKCWHFPILGGKLSSKLVLGFSTIYREVVVNVADFDRGRK